MNLQVDKSLEFSRLSNAIKVPMIILVIFVHENLNLERDGYLGLLLAAMANVSVPVFFLISGYYFFKGEELGKDVYLIKIEKTNKDSAATLSVVEFTADAEYSGWKFLFYYLQREEYRGFTKLFL